MPHLFISHSSENDVFVTQLAADLRTAGLTPWVDHENILPSQDWDESVSAALEAAEAMVLVLTPKAARSQNVKVEWSFFLDLGKPIYPVLLEPCKTPFRLRLLQHVDFTRDEKEALRKLLAALNVKAGGDNRVKKSRAPRKKAAELAPITPGNARQVDTVVVLSGHRDTVRGVAFNADGTILASASDDKNVRLWNTVRQTQIKALIGHEGPVNALAFSPDGTLLASASGDRTVRLWDVARRFGITALRGHTGGVTNVAFSPDGKFLVSASDDETLRLWDVAQREFKFIPMPVLFSDVLFHPAGVMLAVAPRGVKSVGIWDMNEDQWTGIPLPDEGARLAFSPDGKLLAVGLNGGGVMVFDAATRAKAGAIFYADYNANCVRGVAFSPDGALLVVASLDGSLRLWKTADLGDRKRALRVLHGHEGGLCGIAFSPGGQWIASASHDGTVRLWGLVAE
jgi:WD40 repeat protein